MDRWEDRPWGAYRILFQDEYVTVKELWIDEGHQCSLQYHEQRAESFTWKSGQGEIYHAVDATRPGEWMPMGLLENVQDFVPVRQWHRIRGGSGGLGLIEVWIHPGHDPHNLMESCEEDIVRFEDDYGRV